MYEYVPVGLRLPKRLLKDLERLGSEEGEDRSTIVRKLLAKGLDEHEKEAAARKYREGKCSISEAAALARLSIWEFEQFLISRGFQSAYALDDLEIELAELQAARA